MRHITDGELHAWLDGALDLLPDGRGDEIREHLSRCSACRERMQDEEEVRNRSSEILAGLQLRDLELPGFEEIRQRAAAPEPGASVSGPLLSGSGEARSGDGARAESPARYRGPLKGVPMAWAATIVLALGVGWMGGQMWRGLPEATAPLGPSTVEPSAGRAPGLAGSRESEPSPGRAQGPSGSLAAEGLGEGTVRSLPDREPPGGGAGAAAPEPRPVVDKGSPPTDQESGQRVEELARFRAMEAVPSLREMVLTGMAPAAEPSPWPPSLPRDEDRLPESSLAVPGLKVLSVDWEEWLPGERALHIRQLLSVGDTLELRYLGMLMGREPHEEARVAMRAQAQDAGVDRPLSPAVLEASLPPGWNQVEMRWGRGWLVARAPLPEASIKALLRTLR